MGVDTIITLAPGGYRIHWPYPSGNEPSICEVSKIDQTPELTQLSFIH